MCNWKFLQKFLFFVYLINSVIFKCLVKLVKLILNLEGEDLLRWISLRIISYVKYIMKYLDKQFVVIRARVWSRIKSYKSFSKLVLSLSIIDLHKLFVDIFILFIIDWLIII